MNEKEKKQLFCRHLVKEDGCDAIQYDIKFNQNMFSLTKHTSTVECWVERNDPRVKIQMEKK